MASGVVNMCLSQTGYIAPVFDDATKVGIGEAAAHGGLRNQYGTETKLLVQLELTHVDGSVITVCTDSSWYWSNDGAIRFADNKDGEIADANRSPSYSEAAKITSCGVVPAASNNVFITEHETFEPKLITTPTGKKVLDFEQNIAGYAEFCLTAKKDKK